MVNVREDQWKEFINEVYCTPLMGQLVNPVPDDGLSDSYWVRKQMLTLLVSAGYLSMKYDWSDNCRKYTKLADVPEDVPLAKFIRNHKGEMMWVEQVITFPGVDVPYYKPPPFDPYLADFMHSVSEAAKTLPNIGSYTPKES